MKSNIVQLKRKPTKNLMSLFITQSQSRLLWKKLNNSLSMRLMKLNHKRNILLMKLKFTLNLLLKSNITQLQSKL